MVNPPGAPPPTPPSSTCSLYRETLVFRRSGPTDHSGLTLTFSMAPFSIRRILMLCSLFRVSSAAICSSDVCEYDFTVRHARTMVYRHPTKGAYDVKLNGSKLQVTENTNRQPPDDFLGTYVNESDVITADGFQRTVIVINGQFPGPAIEVTEGAQVR